MQQKEKLFMRAFPEWGIGFQVKIQIYATDQINEKHFNLK